MSTDSVKQAIDSGNVVELNSLLENTPELANAKIVWGPEKKNRTDPLHYIADSVFEGRQSPGVEIKLARVLLKHGTLINGDKNGETPLLGATSLAAGNLANLLIDQGADIHATSVHGATALHWSCYTGLPDTVSKLLGAGANMEQKCTQFHATPLFWAIHAIQYGSDKNHNKMIAAIQYLLEAGASKDTSNYQDYSALQLAKDTGNITLIDLLQ